MKIRFNENYYALNKAIMAGANISPTFGAKQAAEIIDEIIHIMVYGISHEEIIKHIQNLNPSNPNLADRWDMAQRTIAAVPDMIHPPQPSPPDIFNNINDAITASNELSAALSRVRTDAERATKQ